MTNCRTEEKTSREELDKTMELYRKGWLFRSKEFPKEEPSLKVLPKTFSNHTYKQDNPYLDKRIGNAIRTLDGQGTVAPPAGEANQSGGESTYHRLSTNSLKRDASKDVWCIQIDQFWMEFVGVPSSKGRPVPFMESFPISVWISRPLLAQSLAASSQNNLAAKDGPASRAKDQLSGSSEKLNAKHRRKLLKDYYKSEDDPEMDEVAEEATEGSRQSSPQKKRQPEIVVSSTDNDEDRTDQLGDCHLLVHIGGRACIQLNHYQYLFLMRLSESVTTFMTNMEEDTKIITKLPPVVKKYCLAVVLPEIELALVCPPLEEMQSSLSQEGISQTAISETSMDGIADISPDQDELAGNLLLGVKGLENADSAIGRCRSSRMSMACFGLMLLFGNFLTGFDIWIKNVTRHIGKCLAVFIIVYVSFIYHFDIF